MCALAPAPTIIEQHPWPKARPPAEPHLLLHVLCEPFGQGQLHFQLMHLRVHGEAELLGMHVAWVASGGLQRGKGSLWDWHARTGSTGHQHATRCRSQVLVQPEPQITVLVHAQPEPQVAVLVLAQPEPQIAILVLAQPQSQNTVQKPQQKHAAAAWWVQHEEQGAHACLHGHTASEGVVTSAPGLPCMQAQTMPALHASTDHMPGLAAQAKSAPYTQGQWAVQAATPRQTGQPGSLQT